MRDLRGNLGNAKACGSLLFGTGRAREALGLERAMPVVLDSAWIPMPELDA
ncbi:MAG: hypothetical protein HRU00_14435 [Myxococcales bacterium]|nr:hypothetical protein [Myxococcales bacterium]